MNINLKAFFLTFMILIVLFGCTSRPEDGVVKKETILNNTTGKEDLQHTEGYVTVDTTGMQLWYDTFGDKNDPKVLLIHGNEAQAISWLPHFYEPLVNAGYFVIRYDCRDNGLSEKFGKPKGFKPKKWTPEQAPPYTLEDDASDVIGLLKKLEVDSAHFVGWSQGGMIAQLVAIQRPDMVKTLTLLATMPSNPFDQTFQPVEVQEFFQNDLAPMVKRMAVTGMFMPLTRKKMIKLTKDFFSLMDDSLSTPYGEEMLDIYIEAYYSDGRKFNPMSWQGMAVAYSKSRANELKNVNIPTLVVNGDKDKLVDYYNAEVLAGIIPNAKLITIKGGGHLFPALDIYSDKYINDIISHLQ
jgi:proline iminopeptidase